MPNLGQLFDELNREYFSGKLRKRPVRWAQWRRTTQKGMYTGRAIYIRRGMSDVEVVGTLCHEMCHIVAGPAHGKRFDAALARLKEQDAPLQAFEFEERYNPHRALPGIIDDLATAPTITTWRAARRCLARELIQSCAKVERMYPWARKRWKRARVEYLVYEKRRKAMNI